jgi:hypothetical protein
MFMVLSVTYFLEPRNAIPKTFGYRSPRFSPLKVDVIVCTLYIDHSLVENIAKKVPRSVSHCGSSDHPDLHVTKQLQIFLFRFAIAVLNI